MAAVVDPSGGVVVDDVEPGAGARVVVVEWCARLVRLGVDVLVDPLPAVDAAEAEADESG